MHDVGQLALGLIELAERVKLAVQVFKRDQPHHVVVVGRQAHQFRMLAFCGGFQRDGQHGGQREAVRFHTEASADLVHMAFEVVRIGAADVHGFRQFAEKADELLFHAGIIAQRHQAKRQNPAGAGFKRLRA